ncbi:MAG TPA: hypothetical protein VG795_10925, partial [Acidimicrobiia bacterium]|nr:hypothetical protein [Acidimicrobiia bacterium]
MELRIGAPVDCSDKTCGTLTRVVADPRTWAVTHLVVEPPGGHVLARLVPIDLVAEAGKRVALTSTQDQWRRLPYVEEVQFVRDPGSGSWGQLILWPLVGPLGGADLPVVIEHLPPGQVEMSGANHIRSSDGPIGRVDGVVVDPDYRLTHILLQEGHLWRKKEVAIPARSVDALTDEIHVALSKHDIVDLPAWSAS